MLRYLTIRQYAPYTSGNKHLHTPKTTPIFSALEVRGEQIPPPPQQASHSMTPVHMSERGELTPGRTRDSGLGASGASGACVPVTKRTIPEAAKHQPWTLNEKHIYHRLVK